MKKWLQSKTAWMAVVMGSLPAILEEYTPEIKQVISDKLGTEWGIVYGVMFAVTMLVMRKITVEPISAKGEKSVQGNGSDQNVDSSGDDGGDGGADIMGLIPKSLCDSDTRGGESDPQRNDQRERGVTTRSKHRRRAKRRR